MWRLPSWGSSAINIPATDIINHHKEHRNRKSDDDAASTSSSSSSSSSSTTPSSTPPSQEQQELLPPLPLDVIFLIELCLPVHSLVTLSAVNLTWSKHMCEAHWHQVFQARWSHCYEGGQGLTVSPSILSRLTGNYHLFWATIEKAFMGDGSIVGEGGVEQESLFERLFKLLQPAIGGGGGAAAAAAAVEDNEDPAAAVPPPPPPPPASTSSSSYASFLFPFPSSISMSYYSYYYKSKVPILPSSWKLACVLRDRTEGSNVLMGCRLCSQLDVFTEHMREVESSCPTQLRTWIVPCLCPALVHRRCLEAHVVEREEMARRRKEEEEEEEGEEEEEEEETKEENAMPATTRRKKRTAAVATTTTTPRRWISYDTALVQQEVGTNTHTHTHTTTNTDDEKEGSLGLCPRCNSFYIPGFRLPTVAELVSVTWQDDLAWKRAGDCILMWLMGVAIVSFSEALYVGGGELWSWPKEGGHVLFWWLLQYVISLNIFLSPRFARVVDLLWLGPIFRFYAKLYVYFLGATFLMLCTFTPLPRRVLGVSHLGGGWFPGWVSVVVAWGNCAVLVVITSIVIFLFWKTNYRIPTIVDLRERREREEQEGEGGGGGGMFEHPMLSIGGA